VKSARRSSTAWSVYRWCLRRELRARRLLAALQAFLWILAEDRGDRRLGVRTHLLLAPDAVEGENHLYEAASYAMLRDLLAVAQSQSPNGRAVLLDAGCGLGRVVAVASTQPFQRIIGFDFDPALVEGAQDNLRAMRLSRQCPEVTVVHADALTYEVPDDVNCVFFFNSFRGAPRRAFFQALRRSWLARRRPLSILYGNVAHFDAAEFPWLKKREEWEHFYPTAASADLKLRSARFEMVE